MRDAAAILKAIGNADGSADGLPAGSPARELVVTASELLETMGSLKALGDFMLFDIDAVDRPEAFEIVYRLLDRGGEGPTGIFTIRVPADKTDPRLPSLLPIWKAADVMEREVWDLMGVVFEGREGLKRILCKDDFHGHPLRKDFVNERSPRFPVPAGRVIEGGQP